MGALPRLLMIGCMMLFALQLKAQQTPVYSQFVYDPYLINPSLLAASGRSEINLMYRQQWTGIADGPRTVQADFQHPFSDKIALGVMVNDDRTVLLSKTSLLGSFAYTIRLSQSHRLGLGLSAGVFSNRIRIEDVDSPDLGDPSLILANGSNWNFNSQFGISYTVRKFSLGVALLQLLENNSFSQNNFSEVKFNRFENFSAMATYRFEVNPNVSIQPNAAFWMFGEGINTLQGSVIVGYKNVSVGGGYRQNFGPTAMLRVQANTIQIGYAYDMPSTGTPNALGGTHEISIKYMFGKEVGRDDNSIFKNYNKWYKGVKKNRKRNRSYYPTM